DDPPHPPAPEREPAQPAERSRRVVRVDHRRALPQEERRRVEVIEHRAADRVDDVVPPAPKQRADLPERGQPRPVAERRDAQDRARAPIRLVEIGPVGDRHRDLVATAGQLPRKDTEPPAQDIAWTRRPGQVQDPERAGFVAIPAIERHPPASFYSTHRSIEHGVSRPRYEPLPGPTPRSVKTRAADLAA